jgi:cytochrome oxidase Cu insertion factor (SCO1/SenC/PrrC family)
MNDVPPSRNGLGKIILFGAPLVVVTVFFFVWRGQVNHLSNRPLSSYGSVPPFQLLNQNDAVFGSNELAGKIWIADFVFTSCPGPCPIISTRMSELQKPLRKTDVHLISFSVDPEKDTPEVLRRYAEKLKAEPARWDFLTGSKQAIYNLSKDGFKLAVSDDPEARIPVHSTRLVLVDRHGIIRGYYDALEPDGVTKVLADANHLLREQPQQ